MSFLCCLHLIKPQLGRTLHQLMCSSFYLLLLLYWIIFSLLSFSVHLSFIMLMSLFFLPYSITALFFHYDILIFSRDGRCSSEILLFPAVCLCKTSVSVRGRLHVAPWKQLHLCCCRPLLSLLVKEAEESFYKLSQQNLHGWVLISLFLKVSDDLKSQHEQQSDTQMPSSYTFNLVGH